MIPRTPFVVLLALVAAATPVAWAASPASASTHVWKAAVDDNWPGHGIDPTNPQACDPIDPAQCMLPYPNDWFTKLDPASATGRRLDLTVAMMPRNVNGKPIEPQEFNRSDGFSAGAQILTVVPGMTKNEDLVPSGLPPVTDLGMNSSSDLGVILLNTKTGQTSPVWTEVDQYTSEAGPFAPGQVAPVQQDLMIHPAINLDDGTRYIVALRHLRDDSGNIVAPSPAFKAYRDGTAAASDPRTTHMNEIFDALTQAGWTDRSDIYLAWDFTTASTLNVTGRLLAIRNDAFGQLGDTDPGGGMVPGDHAPTFTVDPVTNYTPAQNGNIARQITGHFTVPCYIAPTCEPPTKCDKVSQGFVNDCPTPGQFLLDPTNPDATPTQVPGQTYQANFICNVGRSALDNHEPMRPVEYGHGLFGGADEVNSDPQETMAGQHGMMYCATDWTGMATADVPNAVAALQDMSRFPWLTDRVQQGELNFLYLARLMVHPQGFSSNPAFQWPDGKSFIDTTQPYYDGNSQGGIYGGTVCAISIDVKHCVLGVPGMDYSILLPRSSDYVAESNVAGTDLSKFHPTDPGSAKDLVGYSELFDSSYPDQAQRLLVLDLAQTLWDRSDPNGYARHMTTDPLPDTPQHHVLLQLAYGDHQVANITAETEARSIGACGFTPPLEADRYGPYKDPFWGIPSATDQSCTGSAIAIFDSGPVRAIQPGQNQGTDWPPTSDTPNRSGKDPHEAPRRAPCGQQQKDLFLQPDGLPTATCNGAPYGSWDFTPTAGPVLPESPKPVLLAVSALIALAVLSLTTARRRARRLALR